jgi:hypothetical protein
MALEWASETQNSFLSFLFLFLFLWVSKWLFPDLLATIFPVPVTLNRLAADLLVLIFGIS